MGFDFARDFGLLTRPQLVLESGFETFGIKAVQQMRDGDIMQAGRFCYVLIAAPLTLATVCQKQDPRPRESAGGTRAGAGQLGQLRPLGIS